MRNRKSQRGSVMLEFALTAPALFLLVFGAMDLSRVFRSAMNVAAASRAGLHYASSGVVAMDDTAGISQAVAAESGAAVSVSVSHYCTCSIGGSEEACTAACPSPRYVRVSARQRFEPVLKVPGMSPSFTLTSVSRMRIE